MRYFQTDVLHFFIWSEKEHQPFHLILSDLSGDKLICFQPQNVNNLFSAVFIGLLSAKSCFSRNQHSLQELWHLTVSKRITQILNVKGNISVGACLAALWLEEKKPSLNTWVVILLQLSTAASILLQKSFIPAKYTSPK